MNSFLFPRCDLSSVLPTWAMGFIRSRDWIWRLSMVIIIANHLLFGRAAADWFIIETRRICSCKFLCIPRKKSSPVIIPVDLACNRHAFSMQSTKWSESFGNARKRERVINPNQSFNNGPLNQVSPYFRSAPSVETKGLDRYLYGVPYTHTVLSDSIVQWLMLNLASVHIFSTGRKRKIGRKRTQSLCTAQRDVTLVKEQTNNEISTQKKMSQRNISRKMF